MESNTNNGNEMKTATELNETHAWELRDIAKEDVYWDAMSAHNDKYGMYPLATDPIAEDVAKAAVVDWCRENPARLFA